MAPIAIRYNAPADCPDAETFAREIFRRTRRARAAQPQEAADVIEVRIERTPRGARGDLILRRDAVASEPRPLEHTDCGELVRALGLTAALSIDPQASLEAREAPAAETSAPAAASARVASPQSGPSSKPKQRETQRLYLRSGFGFGQERLLAGELWPAASAFAELSSTEPLRLAARVSLFLSGNPLQTSRKASHTHAALSLELCPVAGSSVQRAGVQACVLGRIGLLKSEGRGIADPRRQSRTVWGGGGVVRGWWRAFDRAGLELACGAWAADRKRRFVFDAPRATIGETAPLAIAATLGVFLQVP